MIKNYLFQFSQMFVVPQFQRYSVKKKRSFSLQCKQQNLRLSLMQNARKLKLKLIQETNNQDFNVNKLMNRTLCQIQKYKENYKQNYKQIDQFYQIELDDEQIKTKKQTQKQELFRNIQLSKIRFKKNMGKINLKRKKLYPCDKERTNNKKSVQQMLMTVKQRLKSQNNNKRKQINNTYAFNSNQLINTQMQKISRFNKVAANTLSQSMRTNTLSQSMRKGSTTHNLKLKRNHIQTARQRSQRIMKLTLRNLSNNHRFTDTQLLGLSPTSIRKQINKNQQSKRMYPNAYANQRMIRQNVQVKKDQLGSERSVFVPVGNILPNRQTKISQQMSVGADNNSKIHLLNNQNPGQNFVNCCKKAQNQQFLSQLDLNRQKNIYQGQLTTLYKPLNISSVTGQEIQRLQLQNQLFSNKSKSGFIELQNHTKVRIMTDPGLSNRFDSRGITSSLFNGQDAHDLSNEHQQYDRDMLNQFSINNIVIYKRDMMGGTVNGIGSTVNALGGTVNGIESTINALGGTVNRNNLDRIKNNISNRSTSYQKKLIQSSRKSLLKSNITLGQPKSNCQSSTQQQNIFKISGKFIPIKSNKQKVSYQGE